MENQLDTTAILLTLPEIAAWQITSPPARAGQIIADLPALQRGSVWKVRQIEELWDSILRTFPIGSFILSPPNKELLRQDYKYQQHNTNRQQGTHLLLDGQQRATAIALAFDDIWSRCDDAAKGALWVDLAMPSENQQVEFVFRVLTRAHPWGYLRSNPDEILSSSAIRSALCMYQAVHACPDRRPEDFTLWQTWPWDAEVPLPVAPLIQALITNPSDLNAALEAYWVQVRAIHFLSSEAIFSEDDDHTVKAARSKLEVQRRAIRDSFEDRSSSLHHRLKRLFNVFAYALLGERSYQLPALLLDLARVGADESFRPEAAKDAIELLFIRVNSAGTQLGGEELVYSLIKAEWPEVAEWMQKLPNRPASPSRIASFCIRLVLARTYKKVSGAKASMPEMPDIKEFRRLLRGENVNYPDFRQSLKDFIDNDMLACLEQSWEFLTLPKEGLGTSRKTNRMFRLLPSQAVDLAQKSPDVFLLLLRWIDRLIAAGINVSKLEQNIHRRSLGFLTALSWFAPDKSKACASIWGEIEAELDSKKLIDRFNSTRFKTACRISERFTLRMVPLPSPAELIDVCRRFIDNDGRTVQSKEQATIHFSSGSFWTDDNWWYGKLSKALAVTVQNDWQERLTVKTDKDEEEPQYTSLVEQASLHFLDTLWEAKTSVLLYAQRAWLQHWFPRFDPSLPEMMEDKNRPWDIDHILPQSYFSSRQDIPRSVKDWGNSIGNLRAWPLEANRADGNTTPKKKLHDNDISAVDKRYGICTGSAKREASFVNEKNWVHWQNAVPEGEIYNARYLANNLAKEYHKHRVAAITAIVLRFLTLYRHWYDELLLGDLC